MTGSRRHALIVATDVYGDATLRRLRAPSHDASELARVLGDPEIGGFEVTLIQNAPEHQLRRRLFRFFSDRHLDDLLLLHFSCHGVKDDDGRLYLATTDTTVDELDATALPAEYVSRRMDDSRSRSIILLLDCCYSGAFSGGVSARGGDRVDVKEPFAGDGRGRIVLTASSAMEYAFEGDDLNGTGQPSIFTSAVVKGLETGEANRDGDRWVSVDELYEWVYDQVRAENPKQRPNKWTLGVEGNVYVARDRRPVRSVAKLEQALEELPLGPRDIAPEPGRTRPSRRALLGIGAGLLAAAAAALLLFLVLPSGSGGPGVEIPPGAVALIEDVDNGVITEGEVDHLVAVNTAFSGPNATGAEDPDSEEAQDQAVNDLIVGRWVEGEADDRGITVSDSAVQRRFEKNKNQTFGTEREWRNWVVNTGFSEQDLIDRVRVQLLSEQIGRDVADGSSPSRDELAAFEQEFEGKWRPRTVCAEAFLTERC